MSFIANKPSYEMFKFKPIGISWSFRETNEDRLSYSIPVRKRDAKRIESGGILSLLEGYQYIVLKTNIEPNNNRIYVTAVDVLAPIIKSTLLLTYTIQR